MSIFLTILVQCSSKVQEITDAFLDFAADPSVSMTFHVEREKLERLLDTAHVVARFYATNLVWEGFGVGSSFPHDEGDEAGEGEGAAKKAKIDNREAIQWHKRFWPILWAICGPFLMLMLKHFIQVTGDRRQDVALEMERN